MFEYLLVLFDFTHDNTDISQLIILTQVQIEIIHSKIRVKSLIKSRNDYLNPPEALQRKQDQKSLDAVEGKTQRMHKP